MSGCTHIPYLERRPSGYFFRRRFPTRLRKITNLNHGSFLCLSLRTHVPQDAKTLARTLTALTELAFALTETMMTQITSEHGQLLIELARFEIEAHHALRAMGRSAERRGGSRGGRMPTGYPGRVAARAGAWRS